MTRSWGRYKSDRYKSDEIPHRPSHTRLYPILRSASDSHYRWRAIDGATGKLHRRAGLATYEIRLLPNARRSGRLGAHTPLSRTRITPSPSYLGAGHWGRRLRYIFRNSVKLTLANTGEIIDLHNALPELSLAPLGASSASEGVFLDKTVGLLNPRSQALTLELGIVFTSIGQFSSSDQSINRLSRKTKKKLIK